MNISKISVSNIVKNPTSKKALKVGTAVVAGAVLTNQIAKPKEKEFVPPKTIFGNIALSIATFIERGIYLKKDYKMSDSEYHGDMLNPVLNDTAAKLCSDIYHPKARIINGFKAFHSSIDKLTGFHATAYKQDKDVIISYCGTDNKPSLYSDVQMMLGYIPEQFEQADNFYKEIKKSNPDCDITLVGHSLGGSLAQLISSKYRDVPAITFNAFGTDTIVKRNKNQFKNNHNVYNYIIKGDFISNSSKQVGKTVMLDTNYTDNHDIPNYVNRWA